MSNAVCNSIMSFNVQMQNFTINFGRWSEWRREAQPLATCSVTPAHLTLKTRSKHSINPHNQHVCNGPRQVSRQCARYSLKKNSPGASSMLTTVPPPQTHNRSSPRRSKEDANLETVVLAAHMLQRPSSLAKAEPLLLSSPPQSVVDLPLLLPQLLFPGSTLARWPLKSSFPTSRRM
jgi:hypothetical protein